MILRGRGIGLFLISPWVVSNGAQALAPDEFPPLTSTAAPQSGARISYAYPPVEPLLSARYASLWIKDTVDVVSAPARFDRADWREAGYLGLGLVATVAILDRPLRDLVQRNRTSGVDHFLRDVQSFGTSRYSLPVIGGFYVYGLSAEDRNARATAQDMLIASFVANGTTSIFKRSFGRARPFQGEGPHHFRPGSGDASFPSGHTTHAFAMASVIAHHYDDTWAPYVCYGIAGLVGYARMDHDKHWLSDVVGGAMVGHFVGREIARFNARWRSERPLSPTLAADEDGLTLSWTF